MNKPQIRKKSVIGIALIIVAILFFIFWESYGREYLMYPEVLVVDSDLNRGDIIEPQDLKKVRMDRADGAIDNAGVFEGKLAGQYIKAGEPIYSEYLIDQDMITDGGDGKYIFSLSEDWLSSYPQSLRRGDMAYIYSGGEFLTSAKVAFVKDNDNREVTSSDKERLGASASVSAIEVIVDDNQAALITSVAESDRKLVVLYN